MEAGLSPLVSVWTGHEFEPLLLGQLDALILDGDDHHVVVDLLGLVVELGWRRFGLVRGSVVYAAAGLLICAVSQVGATSEPRSAMAPMGKLRVAFLLGPIYATKDSATGELKGVAIDLGQELAQRIGVPFEPITFASAPD